MILSQRVWPEHRHGDGLGSGRGSRCLPNAPITRSAMRCTWSDAIFVATDSCSSSTRSLSARPSLQQESQLVGFGGFRCLRGHCATGGWDSWGLHHPPSPERSSELSLRLAAAQDDATRDGSTSRASIEHRARPGLPLRTPSSCNVRPYVPVCRRWTPGAVKGRNGLRAPGSGPVRAKAAAVCATRMTAASSHTSGRETPEHRADPRHHASAPC